MIALLFFLTTSINSRRCLLPRSVIASGNSATPFLLESVTFFTSTNISSPFLLVIKKSILLFFPYLTSLLKSYFFPNEEIFFSTIPYSTILFALCVLTPTLAPRTLTTSSVYLSFLFSLSVLDR